MQVDECYLKVMAEMGGTTSDGSPSQDPTSQSVVGSRRRPGDPSRQRFDKTFPQHLSKFTQRRDPEPPSPQTTARRASHGASPISRVSASLEASRNVPVPLRLTSASTSDESVPSDSVAGPASPASPGTRSASGVDCTPLKGELLVNRTNHKVTKENINARGIPP